VELYLHFPTTPSWRGAQLKHRENFTLTCNRNGHRAPRVAPPCSLVFI